MIVPVTRKSPRMLQASGPTGSGGPSTGSRKRTWVGLIKAVLQNLMITNPHSLSLRLKCPKETSPSDANYSEVPRPGTFHV